MKSSLVSVEGRLTNLFEAKWIGYLTILALVVALPVPYLLGYFANLELNAWLYIAPLLSITIPLAANGIASLVNPAGLAKDLLGNPQTNSTPGTLLTILGNALLFLSTPAVAFYVAACVIGTDFSGAPLISLPALQIVGGLILISATVFTWAYTVLKHVE